MSILKFAGHTSVAAVVMVVTGLGMPKIAAGAEKAATGERIEMTAADAPKELSNQYAVEGKTVVITGKVVEVVKYNSGNQDVIPLVKLTGGDDLNSTDVYAEMLKGETKKAGQLKKGDVITIACTGEVSPGGIVRVKKCKQEK